MSEMYQEKLVMVVDSLEGISRTLVGVKEAIEQARPSPVVDDYFQILVALERINEAKERLMKISEKQKEV
jgi:hypothetical protein